MSRRTQCGCVACAGGPHKKDWTAPGGTLPSAGIHRGRQWTVIEEMDVTSSRPVTYCRMEVNALRKGAAAWDSIVWKPVI